MTTAEPMTGPQAPTLLPPAPTLPPTTRPMPPRGTPNTDHPHATVGDEVTLLDSDPLSPASAYQLARWADTIPYEVFSRIGPRVKRVAYDPDAAAGSITPLARADDAA